MLVAPTPASADDIARAQAAMEQKMKQLEAQPPGQPGAGMVALAPSSNVPAQAPMQAPPRPKKLTHTVQPFPPLQAPPVDISAAKQQRLDELLRKYRADELTPEEYHQQRAKTLGEP